MSGDEEFEASAEELSAVRASVWLVVLYGVAIVTLAGAGLIAAIHEGTGHG